MRSTTGGDKTPINDSASAYSASVYDNYAASRRSNPSTAADSAVSTATTCQMLCGHGACEKLTCCTVADK